MKSIFTIAAVACAFAINAATFQLRNGDNAVNVPGGEIVGVECMTVGASQAVTASVVVAVTEFTNAYKSVTSLHTRYDFTVTNFDGNASVATNVVDAFSYSDWTATNGLSRIVGSVSASRFTATNSVPNGVLPKATYTKETQIGSGTASNHYLKMTPASTMHFFGGSVRVQCGDGDNVNLLVK